MFNPRYKEIAMATEKLKKTRLHIHWYDECVMVMLSETINIII